jgi:segregation and condensation protein B
MNDVVDITDTVRDQPAEPNLRAALEAVLLVVDEPVDDVSLAQVLERPRDEISRTLRELAEDYDASQRGFELRVVAGGWRLYTRPSCAPYVERFVRDGQSAKLSQAALETLAVVAYRQPTTRSRIAAVRGVNVDAVIRTLVTRGLIAEVGVEPESGAILYRTTDHFLDRLGIASLEELPEISELLPDHSVLDDDAAAG